MSGNVYQPPAAEPPQWQPIDRKRGRVAAAAGVGLALTYPVTWGVLAKLAGSGPAGSQAEMRKNLISENTPILIAGVACWVIGMILIYGSLMFQGNRELWFAAGVLVVVGIGLEWGLRGLPLHAPLLILLFLRRRQFRRDEPSRSSTDH